MPDPARRWLTQAIAPGTALHTAATITMHGTIHLARGWRAFTATQYLDPERGFSWDAQAKIAGLTATGYDGLTDDGEMHWRLLGASFGHSGTTADITHSAIDRLAAESVLIPTTLLEADWRADIQPGTASFARPVAGRQASSRITIRVNPTGRLRLLTLGRWGNPAGSGFGPRGFRVDFAGERRVQGIATPMYMSAAWLLPGGAWQEAFRAHLDSMVFS